MRMSIEFAGIQLRRSHRALLESNELLKRGAASRNREAASKRLNKKGGVLPAWQHDFVHWEDTLQGLTARRERILKIVRTYPLRAVDNSGAGREQPQDQIVRLHCPAIQELPRETVHALHKGLVTIAQRCVDWLLRGTYTSPPQPSIGFLP
jgi:hypothetical protein